MRMLAWSLAAVLMIAGHAGASPQQPEASDDLTLDATLVEVSAVVTDRNGHYVADLRQTDFAVNEDGTPQEIVSFTARRAPMHIALLMDTSGSTDQSFHAIQAAAVSFVEQLDPADEVMIVSFADKVTLRQDFTSDRKLLVDAIVGVYPKGGTRLYEAVYLTVVEKLSRIEGRKVMIILSDGQDTMSKRSTADIASKACADHDVVVYGVKYPPSERPNKSGVRWDAVTPSPFLPTAVQRQAVQEAPPRPTLMPTGRPVRRRAVIPDAPPSGLNRVPKLPPTAIDHFMERIARDSGGALFEAQHPALVTNLLDRILMEFAHTYVLGYMPTRALSTGGYRKIVVSQSADPKYIVRHRTGYAADGFARPADKHPVLPS